MRKFILFALALVGSIGVWGATSITSESDFKNALGNGGQYILSQNITLTGSTTKSSLSSNLEIDLNGHTVTCTYTGDGYIIKYSDASSKTVKISNGTFLVGSAYGLLESYKGSGVTFDNVTITRKSSSNQTARMAENGKHLIYVSGTGSNSFKDCTITSDYSGGFSIAGDNNTTISGCAVTLTNTSSLGSNRNSCVCSNVTASGCTVTIVDGTYTSENACMNNSTSGGKITVNGGTFISTSTLTPSTGASNEPLNNQVGAIYVNKKGNFTINNGTFIGTIFKRSDDDVYLTINGGTFDHPNVLSANNNYNGADPLNPSAPTSQLITPAAGSAFYMEDNAGVIANKVVAAASKPGDYIRNVTSGSWGTCVFSEKVTVSGAEVYKLLNMDSTGIYLEQVTGVIPAETAFFFKATGSQLILNVSDGAAISMAANGLHGTLEAMNWPEKSNTYTGLTGKYLLTYHNSAYKLAKAADGSSLPPYRAYVVWSEVQDLTPQKAMGRRIRLGANGESEVTGVEDVVSENTGAKIEKFIQNAKLYIRRGNELYDAQGARIK